MDISNNSISQFLNTKSLLINSSKTKFVTFKTAKDTNSIECKIVINKNQIEKVDNIKFLGLYIDDTLSWNTHIDKMCKKLASGLYALRIMCKFSDVSTLKKIYFAFINSHISYGLAMYGCTSHENLNKLLVFQKKAIRIILGLSWSDTVKQHFPELGFFTVFSLYIFELILIIKQNLAALPKLGQNHNYNTRGKNEIAFVKHKLRYFEKKPTYSGIKFYLNLPLDIKEIENFNGFKKQLKKYLLSKPLYSLQEYFEKK